MILQWTSSVNKDSLSRINIAQENYTDTYSYKDLMKYHVWNLYAELTSSGWVPVSSSYSASDGYYTAQSWSSPAVLEFPKSMADNLTQQELFINDSLVYTPSEHCWVTLQRNFSTSEIYYLTIDCRYPLPPHKKNTGLIVDLKTSDGVVSYDEVEYQNELKLFIGATSIEKISNAIKPDNTTAQVWKNKQNISKLDGVCLTDSENILFNMDADSIKYGQDYISRCVSFVDIAIHKSSNSNGTEIKKVTNSTEYSSSTTRVRPKNGKDDEKSWYVCWGFDFLEKNKKIIDYVDLEKYKYAFHHDNLGNFIYQIYKVGDNKFKSGFGLLPVQNNNPSDQFSKITFCVNSDPSNEYDNKSINFNTLGNEVELISGSTDTAFLNNITSKLSNFKNNKTTVNNFFNTCYRNYNFSDGISSIRAGVSGEIGKYMNFPIYSPISPKDASLFLDSLSQCKSTNILPTSLMPSQITITSPQRFTSETENNSISIQSNQVLEPASNFSKRTKNQNLVSIKYLNTGKQYTAYYQENDTDKKRVAFTSNGSILQVPLSSIATTTAPEELLKHCFYALTNNTTKVADVFKTIKTTIEGDKLVITKEVFHSLFNTNIFEKTDSSNNKYVRLYVGLQQAFLPTTRTNSGANVTFSSGLTTLWKNASFTITFINAVKQLNPDDTITTANAIDYLAIVETLKSSQVGNGSRSIQQTALNKWYIDVPITDIYDLTKIIFCDLDGNPTETTEKGDFDTNLESTVPSSISQHLGANYFSVFKSAYADQQTPLVSTIYSFSENSKNVTDKSIFGTINESNSNTSIFLKQKDVTNSYLELPMFLFSINKDRQLFKGYVTDIMWAPTSIQEGSVVADTIGPKNYKKVYWGGCWFPWVSDDAPEI